jgi:hypothetical protein
MLTRDEARRIAANAKLPEAVTAITRWIKGPTGRPRFLPVSRPPPGRDGAYAASVPQPLKLDRARIEAQRGGGFIAGRLHDQREPPNGDRKQKRRARRIAANVAKLPELTRKP